ncbi:uncharacterized protein [Porites lutea]|uniref:uncharacterized protein n=1 Tax=Porites lutea TaxID=51062 RepID=UPI003CC56EDA
MDIDVNLEEVKLSEYKWYSHETYKRSMSLLEAERNFEGASFTEQDVLERCINRALNKLKEEKLPLYRIVSDNIDYEITARVQTKDHVNRSLHWTHQFAIVDRVLNPNLDDTGPQKDVKNLQLVELLPDERVQKNLVFQWSILISQIVTKFLPAFRPYQAHVVYHIPHTYSAEMASKSETCSHGMEFKNPNVAADMSQILKSFHQKYVPCVQDGNNRTVLSAVPLHGDQLLEERARNVQWTFRDGESQYDRLEGLTTEHADWHAKVTLYKSEFDMFVNNKSAAEVGTSQASMNRCGKTNAAKGVQNHYN